MEILLDELQRNQSAVSPAPIDQIWAGRHEQITAIRAKSSKYILDTVFETLPPDSWEEAIPSAFELRDLILKPLETADIFGPYDPAVAKQAIYLILPEALQYPGSILSAIATIKDMREGNIEADEASEENPWILALSHPYDHEADRAVTEESDSFSPGWKALTAERRTQILEGIGKLLKPLKDGIPQDPVLEPEFVSRPPKRRSPNEIEVRDRAARTMPVLIRVASDLGVIAEESLDRSIDRVEGDTSWKEVEIKLARLGKQIDAEGDRQVQV